MLRLFFRQGNKESGTLVYFALGSNRSVMLFDDFFTKVKGTTIGNFILSHKIERVKELMLYEELTLSEIAWKLKYSSVAHLSSQFKKITGLTPSHFKSMKNKRLIALENL